MTASITNRHDNSVCPYFLEKTDATVIALEDLIALKRGVGRPRDIEDIAALESLEDKGEESKGCSDE